MATFETHHTFDDAWRAARRALGAGDLPTALTAFGHAHGLGQCRTWSHVLAHFGFLSVAWRRRRVQQVARQGALMLGALLFTWTWPDQAEAEADR